MSLKYEILGRHGHLPPHSFILQMLLNFFDLEVCPFFFFFITLKPRVE